MTRPTLSPLLIDGEKVYLRLQAERKEGKEVTHVDWLRFTCALRDAPLDLDVAFPLPPVHVEQKACGDYLESENENDALWNRAMDARREAEEVLDGSLYSSALMAWCLGRRVVAVLGEGFAQARDLRKGHDFYARRWAIEFEGKEVGWVGFGARSESPRQRAQAMTLHVNLYGHACTFARDGWREAMADLVEEVKGWVTRIDLACDFFDGYAGGLDSVQADYEAGLCDVRGKRPKWNAVGDTVNRQCRSYYIGSKEAGKQTNVYEKGDELFGPGVSKWVRFELRYGDKCRELPADMLRRPGDFFAGASTWHAGILARLQKEFSPAHVPCDARAEQQTVDAEVARNVNWLRRVAGPSLAAMVKFGTLDDLVHVCEADVLPGRLRGFGVERLKAAFQRFGQGFNPQREGAAWLVAGLCQAAGV